MEATVMCTKRATELMQKVSFFDNYFLSNLSNFYPQKIQRVEKAANLLAVVSVMSRMTVSLLLQNMKPIIWDSVQEGIIFQHPLLSPIIFNELWISSGTILQKISLNKITFISIKPPPSSPFVNIIFLTIFSFININKINLVNVNEHFFPLTTFLHFLIN